MNRVSNVDRCVYRAPGKKPLKSKGLSKNPCRYSCMKIAKRGLVQILPTCLPTGRVLLTYMGGFSRKVTKTGGFIHLQEGAKVLFRALKK